MKLGLPCLLLLFLPSTALTHTASNAYLHLSVDGRVISGQWDIELRDLEYAIGIDANGDGNVTWGELRTRYAVVADYALERLQLRTDSAVCSTKKVGLLVDRRNLGNYAVLRFQADCPGAFDRLTVSYRLLFDLDPGHRGILRLDHDGSTYVAVFGQEDTDFEMPAARSGTLQQLVDFGREGVGHVWSGYDHLLFLICMLMPAVLRREAGAWVAVESIHSTVWPVLKIITVFTVAHSITLAASAIGIVAPASRLVEAAIAASIVIAAANNLYPLVSNRLWVVAFAFGLVHGFGFADALRELLPSGAPLLIALLGFNLGIEVGQIAVVAFLPFAFAFRRETVYRRMVLPGVSLVAAGIALFWFLQRAFGVDIFQ